MKSILLRLHCYILTCLVFVEGTEWVATRGINTKIIKIEYPQRKHDMLECNNGGGGGYFLIIRYLSLVSQPSSQENQNMIARRDLILKSSKIWRESSTRTDFESWRVWLSGLTCLFVDTCLLIFFFLVCSVELT